MDFDLDQRTASLSVGEFSAFTTGPRDAGSGALQGIWRAQLGTHWHNELRARAAAEAPATEFEVAIAGRLVHRGWTLTLTGRIDQLLRPAAAESPPERGGAKRRGRSPRANPPEPRPAAAPAPASASASPASPSRGEQCHVLRDTSPGEVSASSAPPHDLTASAPTAAASASRGEQCHVLRDTLSGKAPAGPALCDDPPTRAGPAAPAAPRGTVILREIKTVTRPLPADESELRAAHPDYFAQLAAYAALARLGALKQGQISDDLLPVLAELVFVETSSGLSQTVALTPADDTFFRVQLERVTEFLTLRHRARERLRHLAFRPAFATPRAGQETTRADLTAAFEKNPVVFFEAPTGFGKTGVLLEFALGQLRAGHFDRVLYLTSKSTGQLQVVRTLAGMSAPAPAASNPMGCLPLSPAPATDPASPAACHPMDGGNREDSRPRENPEPPTPEPSATSTPLAVWHVRNKAEHCINRVFHCVRESCAYLDALETRWPPSGLARFYLDEKHARDLDTLRAAGRHAQICPYEITRAALAFNDVWIGDYNYVFAPANRGVFYAQPGFDPARTLLLLDEAHNLPSRVADAHSHLARAADARALLAELDHLDAPRALLNAWESWTLLLSALRPVDALDPALEADAADTLGRIADQLSTVPLDYAALGPEFGDQLWKTQTLSEWLANAQLKKLLWCPADGELSFTCIDAADAIGATLREFGGVVCATATFGPAHEFAEAIGLAGAEGVARRSEFGDRRSENSPSAPAPEVGARVPTRLENHAASAENSSRPPNLGRLGTTAPTSNLFPNSSPPPAFSLLTAATPWRDGAYDVAVDARVDTKFQHRSRYYATTAATVAALHAAAGNLQTRSAALRSPVSAVAVFFPSYAYAETIARHFDGSVSLNSQLSALNAALPTLRVALQPRIRDLATQAAWVEESLAFSDALFLVLGSSFAESIDLLGGRITHAMVVGPALPEVNAVQRARLAEFAPLGREAAFRRVYQIPGMTKVNQALGRLVRAPGQRARVLLHCQRFLEPSYASLLARDYQFGANLLTDADLEVWLAAPE